MKPITKYAKSGDINIAYQVIGNGKNDLVYIPGWVSNIDMLWEDSKIANFLNYLASFSRLILFDKRGTGLSDRVSALCTLEERMDDICVVMDAVGSQKAILFGHSEGGTVACLFAATYPKRTIALITFGIFAKRKYSKNYPWAPKTKEREFFYQAIKNEWGNGQKMGIEYLMPSLINDHRYYDWFASYLRSSASPGAALALAQMNTKADITNILKSIKARSLILHRTGDRDVKVEEGKYLARKIPNAKFVELIGIDHLFWVGDTYSVIAEIEDFIIGVKPTKEDIISRISLNSETLVANKKSTIENIMLENFHRNLKMEYFAKLCGKSLSTFKRDFKIIFCTTPSRWLIEKRLEYAKTLLLKTNLNINEICYESGFINSSHFIRIFKSKYIFSPNKFRNEYTKQSTKKLH